MSKEIVLVSDNHGRIEVLRKIRELHPNADAYLHCGDAEVDEEHLESFAAVKGNNDTEYDYPETRVIDLGECKILMLHGHQYFMGTRLEQLAKRARHIGCNMAFFGHTHVFHVSTIEGVLLVNPGSVYNNRDGTPPCYALIHNRDGEWKVERKPVPIKENPYWQHWL